MIRPATPGTLLVLVAAILLGLVTISTPIIKSIYFLRATIGGRGNQNGQEATFGTLGYCIGATCSSATLGYQFDPNQLLGINIIPANYTQVIIKGLTYTLVLHPIGKLRISPCLLLHMPDPPCLVAALAFAVVAVLLGLLAHCREMSLTCLTSCFSGIGAFFALVAFGLDLALFVIAKKRIDSVDGASADLGTAIWMTLASWILLTVGACAFSCGVCSRRKRNRVKDDFGAGYGQRPYVGGPAPMGKDPYAEQMRMDALNAEADRKRRQNAGYGAGGNDLPKFAEYETEHEVPLKNDYDDGAYRDQTQPQQHAAIALSPTSAGAVSGSHVPGVGAGYGPRQPSATAAYAAVPVNNAAGHGAHAQRAPSVANSAMPVPMSSVSPPPRDAMYTPGAGPQPYRDGLESQSAGSALAPAPPRSYASADYQSSGAYATSPAHEDPYSSVAAVTAQASMRRQNTGDYGHPTEYSGATFGGAQYSAYDAGSGYPHRAPSEGGSRLRGPRGLAAMPDENPRSPEIEYMGAGAVDMGEGVHARRQPTLDANDGFGLTAQNTSHGYVSEEGGYDHYASSAYGHSHAHSKMATHYEDAHEAPPPQQQQQQPPPPGYESTYGGGGGGSGSPSYGHYGASQYPPEKR